MSANAQPTLCIFPAKGSKQSSAALSAGIKTMATIVGDGSGVGSDRQQIPVDKILAAVLRFAASTSGATYTFRIWGGNALTIALIGPQVNSALLQCMGTGSFTVNSSASAIANTGTDLDGMFLADVVTFTPSTDATSPKGPATSRATAMDEATHDLFSPNDSGATPAELTLSSVGRFGFLVVEFTSASGVKKFALVTRHRA